MATPLDFETRRKQILDLLCQGYTNKAISLKTGLSYKTVSLYIVQYMTVAKVATRVQLVIQLLTGNRPPAAIEYPSMRDGEKRGENGEFIRSKGKDSKNPGGYRVRAIQKRLEELTNESQDQN